MSWQREIGGRRRRRAGAARRQSQARENAASTLATMDGRPTFPINVTASLRRRQSPRSRPRSTSERAAPVYDQGQLGSCTANAIGAAVQFEQIRRKEPKPFAPSRLFIYYNLQRAGHGAHRRPGRRSADPRRYQPKILNGEFDVPGDFRMTA